MLRSTEMRTSPVQRLLLLALAALACDPGGAARDGGRVLLVGLDAATLRVAGPLLQEGLLPSLARIAGEGVHGPLQSFLPLHSPRIWTTIATGKVPEKHGILTFTRPLADGSNALYLSSDRKTHALWNITSDAGLATVVINWWTTFPPEVVDGVMISDHLFVGELDRKRALFGAAAGPVGATAYPEAWEPRALGLARDRGTFAELANPLAVLRPFPRWLAPDAASEIFGVDNAVTQIALAVELELRPRLMMVLLPGIDRVSHFLWGMLEPPEALSEGVRPTPEERAAGVAALRGYYVHTDRLIGLLLERYGPGDLVVVVSDHGFELGEASVEVGGVRSLLTGGHASEAASRGVLFARGPGVRRGAPVEGTSVNDVTPTILTWLGLPLGSDMDGRPAAFLEREPPPPIATYDGKPIERLATQGRGAEPERLEELRALGYID